MRLAQGPLGCPVQVVPSMLRELFLKATPNAPSDDAGADADAEARHRRTAARVAGVKCSLGRRRRHFRAPLCSPAPPASSVGRCCRCCLPAALPAGACRAASRSTGHRADAKLKVHRVDFARAAHRIPDGGRRVHRARTTIKVAGSEAAFRQVDLAFVVNTARAARAAARHDCRRLGVGRRSSVARVLQPRQG